MREMIFIASFNVWDSVRRCNEIKEKGRDLPMLCRRDKFPVTFYPSRDMSIGVKDKSNTPFTMKPPILRRACITTLYRASPILHLPIAAIGPFLAVKLPLPVSVYTTSSLSFSTTPRRFEDPHPSDRKVFQQILTSFREFHGGFTQFVIQDPGFWQLWNEIQRLTGKTDDEMAYFTERLIYAVYTSFAISVVGATTALWWILLRVWNQDAKGGKDGLLRSEIKSQSGVGSEEAWS